MKESEIKVAHCYSNGKIASGRQEREVLGSWYTYNGKKINYITYKIVYNDCSPVDDKFIYTILRKSFARWAKEDVT